MLHHFRYLPPLPSMGEGWGEGEMLDKTLKYPSLLSGYAFLLRLKIQGCHPWQPARRFASRPLQQGERG